MLYYGGKKVLCEVKDLDVILYEALLNYANLVYCQRCKRATEDILRSALKQLKRIYEPMSDKKADDEIIITSVIEVMP